MSMIHYLYVKTHRLTGLKYLGKTTQDPYKYKGSGVYWVRHLVKHGNDVDTEILKECLTKEEIKNWGMYYSDLWNVVESDEWANLKPEEGDGAATGIHNHCKKSDVKSKISNAMSVIAKNKVINGTHNFLSHGGKSLSSDRVNNGSHNFLGKTHPHYDHNIYQFRHEDGRVEQMNKHEFIKKYSLQSSNVGRMIKRERKSHRGWQVIFDK